MASKPWNPRKLKNEIADAIREMHRLSCAINSGTTVIVKNEKDVRLSDIQLVKEEVKTLKSCMDRLAILWEVAAFPNNGEGILEED